MRIRFLIVFILFNTLGNAQLFKGEKHLEAYEEELVEIDKLIRSNPRKFKSSYTALRQVQQNRSDEILGAALDIYQGSHYYFLNNVDSAIFYFKRAMSTAEKHNADRIYRTAKIRKLFTDEYKKTYYQLSKEMEEIYVSSYNARDTINMLYSLNGLGLFYDGMDSMAISMKIYYEALKLAELSGNKTELGFIHNNLGLIKLNLGANDSARADFMECIEIGKELDNVALISIGRQNMGLYYTRVDSIELAHEQYEKVIEIGEKFNFLNYVLSATTNLSAMASREGDFEAGDSLSRKALEIGKEGSFLFALSSIYLSRTYLKMRLGDYDEALRMLDSAKHYSQYTTYSEIMPPINHLQYRIYEEMGDYQKALEAYKEKVAVNDSLDELGNSKLLAELQFRYNDEKKERIRSIRENKLKLELKESEVEMARYRQKVIIIISLIILVLLVLVVLYFRLKQKSDNLFSFTIANKLEEERGRIARDLHDGLGQSMIVLKNRFNKLNVHDENEVKKLNNNFSEVIEEVRSISRSLIPPELRRLGLKKAIENMTDEIEKATNMLVTTDLDVLSQVHFDDHQSIRLYRIIQELCTNSVKHSRATSLKITTEISEQKLWIIFQDNGLGLDLDKWKSAENTVGFKSIQQRLKYLNGQIIVDKPKKGFKATIKVPIPKSL